MAEMTLNKMPYTTEERAVLVEIFYRTASVNQVHHKFKEEI
jgi:hypothetical protein